MSGDLYTLLALAGRYWFAALGLMIVILSFHWLFRDRAADHRRLRELPDAGLVGRFLVLHGSEELPEDAWLDVPLEGTLGSLLNSDIPVPCPGVAKSHVDFAFLKGKGLQIRLRHGCTCVIDGEELTWRTIRGRAPMRHGSVLEVGEAMLRLYLFAGLETPREAIVASLELPEAPGGEAAAPPAAYPPQGLPETGRLR